MPSVAIDTTKLSGGYNGAFYSGGNQLFTCSQWSVEASVKTSTDQVLGDILEYTVPESVSFTLKFTELAINSDLPAVYLGQLQQGVFPNNIQFQGVRLTLDGQQEYTQMVACVMSGTFPISGAQAGQTYKRAYQFMVNAIPTFQSTIN